MDSATRINLLLSSGQGFSIEAVAAIVGIDTETVVEYLADPTTTLPSGGGGVSGVLVSRFDFGTMTDGLYTAPESPDVPNLIMATVDFIGDGATAIECIAEIQTPDGATTFNIGTVQDVTLADGDELHRTLVFVCPPGYKYGFNLGSDLTTSLANVWEQPLA